MITKSKIVYIRRKGSDLTDENTDHDLVRYTNDEAKALKDFDIYQIGSSFKGQGPLRGLTPAEEILYLTDVLGVQPSSNEWNKATKEYWANISENVPAGEGLKLEIGFEFPTEDDATRAEEQYQQVNKDRRLEEHDFSMYQANGGTPIDIPNYILYRYCLKYSKVANRPADVKKSPNITMYIYSKEVQAQIAIKKIKNKNKANQLWYQVMSKPDVVDAIIWIYGGVPHLMQEYDKEIYIDSKINTDPDEFIRIADDNKLKIKAFLYQCINFRIIERIPNTEHLIYGDTTIGYSFKEAISNLTSNKPEMTVLFDQLKGKLKTAKEQLV